MSASDRTPGTPVYVLALTVCGLAAYDLLLFCGLGDVRRASDTLLVGLVLAIALLFWPVFALCLANLMRRQAWRALGGVLHTGCMVSLMLTAFADPSSMPLLPASTPSILLAWLGGWLAVEVSLLASVQRHLQALTAAAAVPGTTTAA